MANKRAIKAKDMVNDIRAGLTNLELMEKYQLSSKGLQSIFTKLIEAKAVQDGELGGRVPLAEDTVRLDHKRVLPRNYVVVRLPVYEAENLIVEGHVRDISEKGLQVAGLSAAVGQGKTLLLQATDFADIHPFAFEACCRWVKSESDPDGSVAGFEITDISDGAMQELQKLIQALTIAG
jgi:hypothetical protein